jgi:type IV pilus assembly protein PilA
VYKKRHLAKGFTLIEALAVIAIIGLLSAFAIPSYLDYLTKTRVSEMFVLARTAQLGIADAIYSGTIMTEIHNEQAGITWVDNQHERIESITVESGRVIMKGKSDKMSIPKAKAGDFIIVHLIPQEHNGTINWQCGYTNVEHKKFLPKHCVLSGFDDV